MTPIQTDTLTRAGLVGGAVAGPLFVVTLLVEGATRADYDPFRHPISALAVGDLGWTQRANFIVTGLLLLAFAFGLRRGLQVRGPSRWGPLLVGAVALGLVGAGLFVTDPVNGYPPGTPNLPTERSTAGVLHDLFSTFVFFGLPAAAFVLGRWFARRGQRGWAGYSIVTGFAFLIAFVLTSSGFRQAGGLADIAGLLQRITLVIGLSWLTLVAAYHLRWDSQIGRARPAHA